MKIQIPNDKGEEKHEVYIKLLKLDKCKEYARTNLPRLLERDLGIGDKDLDLGLDRDLDLDLDCALHGEGDREYLLYQVRKHQGKIRH